MVAARHRRVLAGWGGKELGCYFPSRLVGNTQIFQQLGGQEECPPLESEDEFRIEPSCFCSGKSKLSELFQPFQIAIFLLLQLTEASSYLCTGCAQGKERMLELHSDEATGKSHSPLQTCRIITSHYMVFSPAARFVSSLSWQSRSGVWVNLSLWLPSSVGRFLAWQPEIRQLTTQKFSVLSSKQWLYKLHFHYVK